MHQYLAKFTTFICETLWHGQWCYVKVT